MDVSAADSSRMLDLSEAQDRALGLASPLPRVCVAPDTACGRVLFEDMDAPIALPLADLSVMDGWAVHATDLEGGGIAQLAQVGRSTAGHPPTAQLGRGETMRIFTGAVLPTGADAVVPQENADVSGDTVRFDPKRTGVVEIGTFVRRAGSELRAGERLLDRGRVLSPGDVALAAGAGITDVPIHRPPNVAIVSTGDELVPVGTPPRPGQVVSTNGLMLADMVREAGGIPIALGDVIDDAAILRRTMERGLNFDVLVTTGGVSVGDHDLVHHVLAELGCRFVVERVRVRPGKPVKIGKTDRCLVFGLPGNPASAFVSFELFVRPVLQKLLGRTTNLQRPRRSVVLADELPGAGDRAHFVRVYVDPTGRAHPRTDQGSGNLRSISGANALIEVPAGTGQLAAGSTVEAIVIDPEEYG